MTTKSGAGILRDFCEQAADWEGWRIVHVSVGDLRSMLAAFEALEAENANIAARVEAETIKRRDTRIVEIAIGDRERRIVRQAIQRIMTGNHTSLDGKAILENMEARFEYYLSSGGLFNPKLMYHAQVSILIRESRDATRAIASYVAWMEAQLSPINQADQNGHYADWFARAGQVKDWDFMRVMQFASEAALIERRTIANQRTHPND